MMWQVQLLRELVIHSLKHDGYDWNIFNVAMFIQSLKRCELASTPPENQLIEGFILTVQNHFPFCNLDEIIIAKTQIESLLTTSAMQQPSTNSPD